MTRVGSPQHLQNEMQRSIEAFGQAEAMRAFADQLVQVGDGNSEHYAKLDASSDEFVRESLRTLVSQFRGRQRLFEKKAREHRDTVLKFGKETV